MFPSDATKVATSWNTLPLRQIAFLLLRVAIGITILVYLAKSGQINFSSLTRLFRVLEYFSRPIWSIRVPVWRTPNRLSLRGGGVTGSRQRIYPSRLQLTEASLPAVRLDVNLDSWSSAAGTPFPLRGNGSWAMQAQHLR